MAEKKYKTRTGKEIVVDTSQPLSDERIQQLTEELDSTSLADLFQSQGGQTSAPTNASQGKNFWEHFANSMFPPQVQAIANPAIRNRLIGGATGWAAGGPIGGAMGAIFPPESVGEVAANMVGMGKIPKLGKAVPALQKLAERFPTLTSAVGNAGQYVAGDVTRQAIDNQSVEVGPGTLAGALTSGLAGGLVGNFANRLRNSSVRVADKLRQKLTSQMNQLTDDPAASPLSFSEVGMKDFDRASPLRAIVNSLQEQRQKQVTQIRGQLVNAVAKRRATALAQKQLAEMQKTQGLAMDKATQNLTATSINFDRQINFARADINTIKKYGLDPASGKPLEELLEKPKATVDDVFKQMISEASGDTEKADMIELFNVVKGHRMTPSDVVKSLMSVGEPKLAEDFATRYARAEQRARTGLDVQLREEKDRRIKALEDQIYALNEQKKRVAIQKQRHLTKPMTSIASDPALRSASANVETISKRMAKYGVDLVAEQNEVARIKDSLQALKSKSLFTDPVVGAFLKPGSTGILDDETLIKNIMSSSVDEIKGFVNKFTKDGPETLALRNTYILNLLRNSYKPELETFDFSHIAKNTDTVKLRELFGGGQHGQEAVENFQAFLTGVDKLQKVAKYNEELKSHSMREGIKKLGISTSVGLLAALPTGLLFHMPYYKVAEMATAVSLLHLPMNQKFVDYIANSKLGPQFLKWAEKGGHYRQIKLFPALNQFFRTDAKEVE